MYVQHGDYSQQYCTLYLKVAKRVDLKNSHRTHTKLCEVMDMLTNLIEIVILQYIKPLCYIS